MAKYSKSIVRKIASLIKADSYTIAEICQRVGISESTYYEWQKTKPEFSENIKNAEEARMQVFVAEAKKSLLKMIQGYTVYEKKTITVDSGKKDTEGKTMPKIKEQSILEKHFQPNVAAVIFALTNGDPDNWKNRQNSEVTGKGGKDLIPPRVLSPKEIKEYLNQLENEY